MPMTPEDQSFISALRFRMAPGAAEPPTLDEMKRAILLLRDSRSKAVAASAAGRATKKAKAAPTAAAIDDALSDLDSM
jgi:hypothetical protein